MLNFERYCIVASHPDDEILGCGGTLARLRDADKLVQLIILGEGPTSRSSDAPTAAIEAENQLARLESLSGVFETIHLKLSDNRFDTYPLLDIVRLLETVTAEFRPECIICQSGGDLNIDHSLTFRAALTAFRPVPNSTLRAFYVFEVPSSTEWSFGLLQSPFSPNFFVDISSYLEQKLEYLRCYNTEIRPAPHPRSYEGVRNLAAYRGQALGVRYAEAFQLVWALDVSP